ncbi:VOC family protein [Pseudoalteromonas sp.]|uniref:VOC family protein n=1 Tax=Pseudoalteromonas sp. TaxID=53249 RepID=UPI00356B4DB3
MKLHYLEIVTHDVDSVCSAYEMLQNVRFSNPDEMLGGARTTMLSDGSSVGVRAPLHEKETPVTRPYWHVEDIEKAIAEVERDGAEVALPPLDIPGKGKFAIFILGAVEQGFWQG